MPAAPPAVLANTVAGRPRAVLAAALLLTAAALAVLVDWSAPRIALAVDPSIRALLPRDSAGVAAFEDARERFRSDDVLLVAWIDDALFTPARLAALKSFTRTLERMPGVAGVDSLATALETRVHEDYTEVRPYLAEVPDSVAAARAVRDAALANPLYAGYLVARDGTGVMLAVRFVDGLASRTLIERVKAIAAASRAAAGDMRQFLSGPLFVRLEISRLLLDDLYRVLPLAVAMTLLVVLLAYRHLHGVVLTFTANAIALLATLALFVVRGHTLNYVTVILPPTVYVVGFAYAIHVISEFDRHRQAGVARRDAVRNAVAEVAGPVSLTALTTMFGFAALATSAIESIRLYGLYAALGTALAWLAALTVVPAGLALWPRHAQATGRPLASRRVVGWLAHIAEHRARTVLLLAAMLAFGALLGARQIRVGTDYLDNFPRGSEVRQDFDTLSQTFAGAVPLQVVLSSETLDAFKTPGTLRAVAELQRWLLEQPEIGGVYSLLDYIGVLERSLAPELVDDDPVPASAGIVRHLVLLGADDDIRRFVDAGFRNTLLEVRTQAVGSAALNALSDRIAAHLAAELPDTLHGTVTGSACVIARTLDDVTRGQVLSLGAALLPITAMLLVVFRSLRAALLALVPNVLPIVVFFGVLGWSGLTLNLTTSLVAAVVLGIAVDDSIHLLLRLRAARRATGNSGSALRHALSAVIRPVTFTTAGLAIGFATLLSGTLRSQSDFGLLAAVTLLVAWLLDLMVTPALGLLSGEVAGDERRE